MTFHQHIDSIVLKCNNKLNPLAALSRRLKSKHLEMMYMAYILPHLEYGSFLFHHVSAEYLTKLDRIHYRGALIVSGCLHGTNSNKVLNSLGLSSRRDERLLTLMYDNVNHSGPSYISNLFRQYHNPIENTRTRHSRSYRFPIKMSHAMRCSTIPKTIRLWDSLSDNIKTAFSRNGFKYKLRKHLLGEKNKLTTTKLNLSRTQEKNSQSSTM